MNQASAEVFGQPRRALVWQGSNRREAIEFLDGLGSRWRGFTGQWSSKDGYRNCTVEFRGRDGVESATHGQRIELAADGHLRAVGASDA
jgi:hypothetical protein